MANKRDSLEEILDGRISGYHQYRFQGAARLSFVSRNLCEMLGCPKQGLLRSDGDGYAARIHEADRVRYGKFLHALGEREQTATAQYRLLGKNGEVHWVRDTATSKRSKDGTMVCDSVLADVTALQTENEDLRALHKTLPYGFVRYTSEKQPRVTHSNEQMRHIVRFPDGAEDPEMTHELIQQFIPVEERPKFAHFLEETCAQDSPVSGELTLLRCDGTRARVYGWASKCINEQGIEEFQSVCMDITTRYQKKKARETERYLRALSDVYDKIFSYDFSNMTVRYVHGVQSDAFQQLKDLPMQMEEAVEQWLEHNVLPEDRPETRAFFQKLCQRQFLAQEGRPQQIRFRSLSSHGEPQEFIGSFLKTDEAAGLFCCRRVRELPETDSLRLENESLRTINENMQELMLCFSDGVIAFELEGDYVQPLYASDNVCGFFGYSREEWQAKTQEKQLVRDFVARSSVAYEEFVHLIESGEAEYVYRDLKTDTERRVKAICSNRTADGKGIRYVMLYHLTGGEKTSTVSDQNRVLLRTFGYFDVFVDGKPIAFRNEKSKELLALLADRRGGYISSEEAIGFLWEDETINAVTLARYRKVALRLKNILEEYGISDIVESVNGKRRLVTEKVRCDLYDYLTGKEEFSQLFKGGYLTNYSWGELTLGTLLNADVF